MSQCVEASFSLIGEYEAEYIEGVETFKYLGPVLERSDDYSPAVLRNSGKAYLVWRRIGKLLRRNEADPRVSEMLYWEVL